MDRLRLFRKVFFIAVMAFALNIPTSVDAADRGVRRGKIAPRGTRLSLPQAISIAVARNLRMADSRLAVREREHQSREAFCDFFPSISLQYTATADKYRQIGFVQQLARVQDSWIIQPEFRAKATDQINRTIGEEFRKLGIEMPFPQREVHIRTDK